MSGSVQGLRIAIALASLVLIHVAITEDAQAMAVLVALIGYTATLGLNWFRTGRPPGKLAIAGVVVVLAALLVIWLGYASAVTVVLAPSVIFNAGLLVIFGHTLLPGREPLITRFRRIDVGFVAPVFVSYTRTLTALWTLIFAVGTTVSLGAALWGDIALWSWLALIVLPIVTAVFFVGEHVYRAIRYGPEAGASLLRTLRIMTDERAWALAPAGEPEPRRELR
jgi:uncharacterized membrane protein